MGPQLPWPKVSTIQLGLVFLFLFVSPLHLLSAPSQSPFSLQVHEVAEREWSSAQQRDGNLGSGDAAMWSVQREPSLLLDIRRRLQLLSRLWMERSLRYFSPPAALQVLVPFPPSLRTSLHVSFTSSLYFVFSYVFFYRKILSY